MKQFRNICIHTLQMMYRLPVSWCKISLIIVCQKFYKMQCWEYRYTVPNSFKDSVRKCNFFSSSVWTHMHWMLSLLSYAKVPVEMKRFRDLWEPSRPKIPTRGIKWRLWTFIAFLFQNFSGCAKEGAQSPPLWLMWLFTFNICQHKVKVLEIIFKMSGRRAL